MAAALAAWLHNNPKMAYRWSMIGHFMPRFDFELAFALSIRDRRSFDLSEVEADLARIAQAIQSMTLSTTNTITPTTTASAKVQPIGSGVGSGSGEHRHSEQKR